MNGKNKANFTPTPALAIPKACGFEAATQLEDELKKKSQIVETGT